MRHGWQRDMDNNAKWEQLNPKKPGKHKCGKTICHGLWVDGKVVPESEEHLYLEEESKRIRTMTPLENQWMDFKKILSELVVFQEDYEHHTQDKCPGNKYYADKLMAIVNRAREAISDQPEESDNLAVDKFLEDNPRFCDQIAKRKIEEFIKAHHPAIADEYSPIFKVLDWLDQGGE